MKVDIVIQRCVVLIWLKLTIAVKGGELRGVSGCGRMVFMFAALHLWVWFAFVLLFLLMRDLLLCNIQTPILDWVAPRRHVVRRRPEWDRDHRPAAIFCLRPADPVPCHIPAWCRSVVVSASTTTEQATSAPRPVPFLVITAVRLSLSPGGFIDSLVNWLSLRLTFTAWFSSLQPFSDCSNRFSHRSTAVQAASNKIKSRNSPERRRILRFPRRSKSWCQTKSFRENCAKRSQTFPCAV